MNETGQIVRKAPKVIKLNKAVPIRCVNKDLTKHKDARWMTSSNTAITKLQTSSNAEIPKSSLNECR